MTQTVFSVKRACPSCGRSFPELDPRLFSFNSQPRLVRRLLRHRPQAHRRRMGRRARQQRHRGPRARFVDRLARSRRNLPGVQRPPPQPRSAGGALPRPLDRRTDRARRSAKSATLFRDITLEGREAEIARDLVAELEFAARFPEPGRPRLSRARPLGADAVRRRSAAHPARRATRLESARRLLHPRRTDHRPASARQPHPARHAGQARSQGQHAAGGRARRGHHPARRARDRSRPRRRQARRPRHRRGHGRGTDAQSRNRSPAAFCANRSGIRCIRTAPVDARRRRRSKSPAPRLHNLQQASMRACRSAA